jgi:hypothetical protein
MQMKDAIITQRAQHTDKQTHTHTPHTHTRRALNLLYGVPTEGMLKNAVASLGASGRELDMDGMVCVCVSASMYVCVLGCG